VPKIPKRDPHPKYPRRKRNLNKRKIGREDGDYNYMGNNYQSKPCLPLIVKTQKTKI
jgi:hypothetical protein